MQQKTSVQFTFWGIVALFLVMLALATNRVAASVIVWLLVIIIVVMVVANAQNFMSIFVKTTTGGTQG